MVYLLPTMEASPYETPSLHDNGIAPSEAMCLEVKTTLSPAPEASEKAALENLQIHKVGREVGALGVNHTLIDEDTPPTAPQAPKKHTDRSGRKPKGAVPRPKGGKGHFSKQIKSQLVASGKLNATPPMPEDQRRARRKKRKRK